MKVKTMFKKFLSVFLSGSILVTGVSGLTAWNTALAAENEENMHFIMHHWHTVTKGESSEVTIEGYMSENTISYDIYYGAVNTGENYVTTGDGDFIKGMEGSEGHADKVAIPEGIIEVKANSYEGKEKFAGFSITAGHATTDGVGSGEDSSVQIEYNGNIHLVKGHVFYTNESRYVSGVDTLVNGSMNISDDRDTAIVYLYPKGTVVGSESRVFPPDTVLSGEPIVDEDGKYFTETHKTEAIEYLKKLVTNSDITVEGIETADSLDTVTLDTIKFYSTSQGLHTDKTAYLSSLDSRTFDLSLEAWYMGTETADIGMILDASGSMAYTSDDPVRINVEDLVSNNVVSAEELKAGIDENGFLNNDVLDKILLPTNTDNSALGVSDYTYYIFDPRSGVDEYVPLKYWDGTSVEEDNGVSKSNVKHTELIFPLRDNLVGYYGIAQRGLTAPSSTGLSATENREVYYYRDWFTNSAKTYTQAGETTGSLDGSFAKVVERKTLANLKTDGFVSENFISYSSWLESHPQDPATGKAEVNPWSDGLHFGATTGYGVDPQSTKGMYFDASSSIGGADSAGFTISFAVQVASRDSGDKQELLYIGDSTGTDYYKLRRTGTSLSLNLNDSKGTTCSLSSVFSEGEWEYLTYVFENKEDESGEKVSTVTIYKNGEPVTVTNGEGNVQTLSANLFDGDELFVILNGIQDEADGHKGVTNLDEFYVFDTPLSSSDVSKLYNFSAGKGDLSEHKNNGYNDITGSSIEKEVIDGSQTYIKTANGNIFLANENIFGKYIPEAERKGWYYVNFSGSSWSRDYGNSDIGTAITAYAIKPVSRNGSDDEVLDFVYYGSTTPSTGAGKDSNINEVTVDDNPTDDYKRTFIEYTPGEVLKSKDTGKGYSPIKFFVNEEGYLCCFYTAGNGNTIESDSYGWTYVCQKDDTSQTKVESLQYALSSFTTQLLESSPQSEISAVRFSAPIKSGENISMPEDRLDDLVLLDWTSDSKQVNKMLSLSVGEGTSTGSMTSDERFAADGTTLGTIEQYNYGLTGGTNTFTGLKSYKENLDNRAKESSHKYLIIFTDGKDTELSLSSKDVSAMDVAIRQTEAYKLAKELREDYTIFTVMFSGGTVKKGQILYDNAVQFLATIAGDTYTGSSDEDIESYKHVFVGDDSNSLTQAFNEIKKAIATDLSQYTVQDYIDPRFNIVDADGNVYTLNEDGEIGVSSEVSNVTTVTVSRDISGNVVKYDYLDNVAVVNGKISGLDKDNGIKIVLTKDDTIEGKECILFFDKEANLYYLVWEGQVIPGGAENDTRLPVWNASVKISAKEDFIGGNAVLTNGNESLQNFVYREGNLSSSGTDMSVVDGETVEYPSKGFPRVTVNVPVPDIEMTDGSQLIYMGESLTSDGVAKLLGDNIRDSLLGSSAQYSWYWEYLSRYAEYQNKYNNGRYNADNPLLGILEEIVKAADTETGTIAYDYYYLPDETVKNLTGSDVHHEKDKFGELVFKWEDVTDSAAEYPVDGITKDTETRQSKLTVTYEPTPILNSAVSDGKGREYYNSDIVYDDTAYKWNSDFKPVVGTQSDKGDSRLTADGSYITNIISGEIQAQLGISDTSTYEYLVNHYPNRTITYSGNIIRNYGEDVKDDVVGTFTATYTIPSEVGVSIWETANLTLTSKYSYVKNYDLPIGTYTLEKVSSDAPAGFVFNDSVAVDLSKGDYSSIFKGYNNAQVVANTGSANNKVAYSTDKAAFYTGGEIYLGGYGSGKYTDGVFAQDGKTRKYTDDLFGLFRVDGLIETGNLKISKTIDDTISGNPDTNKTFTFKVALRDGDNPVVGSFGVEMDKVGYNEVVFNSEGVATIELKHNEAITILGIPAGVAYSVVEIDSTAYTQDAENSIGTTGTIPKYDEDGTIAEAKFVNIYSANGSLSFELSKAIEGRPWSKNDSFDFNIVADEDTTRAINDGIIIMPAEYKKSVNEEGNNVYTITIDADSNLEGDGIYKVIFGSIRFTTINETPWVFTISEYRDEDERDLIYDNTSYALSVVVSEKVDSGETIKDGNLEVSATFASKDMVTSKDANGSDAEPISFVNQAYVDWGMDISKVLQGRAWSYSDLFRFEISQTGGDTSKVSIENENLYIVGRNTSHSTSFGKITFYAEGEYTFKVKESTLIPEEVKEGLVYDTKEYSIQVTVGVDENGQLVVSKVLVNNEEYTGKDVGAVTLEFINTYTANGIAKIDVSIDKDIAGRPWQDTDFFDFELIPDEADTKTQEAVAEGKISIIPDKITVRSDDVLNTTYGIDFTNITFEDGKGGFEDKTYSFILREVIPDGAGSSNTVDGLTYSTASRVIKVTLKDNGVGSFTTSVTGNEDTFAVTNTYSYQPTDLTVDVTKTLEGRPWKNGDSFEFKLTYTGGSDGVTMPEEDVVTVDADTVNHSAKFGKVEFSKEGTYTFEIKELPSEIAGITDDITTHTLTVKVSDSGKGSLYIENMSGTVTKVNAQEVEAAFTNKYAVTTSAKYAPEVVKTLIGKDWETEDAFEFEWSLISAPEGAILDLPQTIQIGKGAEGSNQNTGKFDELTLSKIGDYIFRVKEVAGDISQNGIINDTSEYLIYVHVKDNLDSALSSEVVKIEKDGKEIEKNSDILFENVYADYKTKTAVTIIKDLQGKDWENELFNFNVQLENEDTYKDGSVVYDKQVVLDSQNKYKSISAVFTELGTYKFIVSEENTGIRNMQYAEPQEITVKVTRGSDGSLVATPDNAVLTFKNVYTKYAEWSPEVKKALNREWVASDIFSFSFDTGEDYGDSVVMPENKLISIDKDTLNSTGKFDLVKFYDVGTYRFDICEVIPDDAIEGVKDGITYDTKTHTADVTVEKLGNRFVVANVLYDGENDTLTIYNEYTAKAEWPPMISKTLEGRPWAEDDVFEFNLKLQSAYPESNEKNVIIPETTVTIEGTEEDYTKAFDDVVFSAEGLYTFTLSETKPEVTNGIVYDDTVYVITVDVVDENHNGVLTPTVQLVTLDGDTVVKDIYNDKVFNFVNTYDAKGTLPKGSIVVNKVLNGRDWVDTDEFNFKIETVEDYGEAVELTEDIINIMNTEEKKGTFGDINFTEEGTYKFKVYEVTGNAEFMTYDSSEHVIEVSVVDNMHGELVAEVVGDSEFTFTNVYDKPEEPPVDTSSSEPETSAPEPETSSSETSAPETSAPETSAPETTVPKTSIPAPETTVPEITIPETTVPETTVPETTIPETTVPETTPPVESTEPDNPDTGVGLNVGMLWVSLLMVGGAVAISKSRKK